MAYMVRTTDPQDLNQQYVTELYFTKMVDIITSLPSICASPSFN